MFKFLALLLVFAASSQVHAGAQEKISVSGSYTFEDGMERTFAGDLTLKSEVENHVTYKGKIEIANFNREGKSTTKKIELHLFMEDGKYYAFFCFNTFSTQFQNLFDLDGLIPVDKKVYPGTIRHANMFGGTIEKANGTISFSFD